MKSLVASKYVESGTVFRLTHVRMKLNIVIQSIVVTILRLIILLSVPTITNVQATANQLLAVNEKMCRRVLNEVLSSFNSYLNSNASFLIVA